jgi:hypothetical protein
MLRSKSYLSVVVRMLGASYYLRSVCAYCLLF